MSNIFVVTSGSPAAEMYDREVHICLSDSEDSAKELCGWTSTRSENWLWGPHAWPKNSLEQAIEFALYRGCDERGQVYSYFEAHGFENNKAVVDSILSKAAELERK